MEKTMVLYNKNQPVLETVYDDELHRFTRIIDTFDIRYAPPAILDNKGNPNRKDLNDWWEHRAIPASRNHLSHDFPYLDSPLSLVERNMGLSLSDRYWVTDDKNLRWNDVNFFDNPFSEDLGLVTLGECQQSHDFSEDMFSPNSTLNGDLRKKWTIRDGNRLLLKAGSGPFCQEPYNEVVATALHEALLQPGDFVPYALVGSHCACPDMLQPDEELIPMWDLLKNAKKPNHLSDFRFCIELCVRCGIPESGVLMSFEKMFACDFILANHDRHYRNFGVIRDVETLRYKRLAPIYDTGSCLWHDKVSLERPLDYVYAAKPFGANGMDPKDQLRLFDNFKWFGAAKPDGFPQKAAGILRQNPLLPEKRINRILDGLERNMEYVSDYVQRLREVKI